MFSASTHSKETKRFLVTLLSLSLLVLIDAMSFGIVIPLFAPLFMDPQHSLLAPNTSLFLRQFLYGVVFCVPLLTILIGSPLLGHLSDQWGRKKVLMLGLAGVLVSFSLTFLAIEIKSIALLIFSRALMGLMDGTQSIAQAAVIDISTPENKAKNLSFISAAGTLGFIFGPLLGGLCSLSFLNKLFGYGAPYIAANLAIVTNLILLGFSFRETRQTQAEKKPFYLKENLRELLHAFADKRIFHLSISFLIMELVWSIFFVGTVLVLTKNFHYGSVQISWYSSYLSCVFTVSLLLVSQYLLKKMTVLQCALLGFAILILGTLGSSIAMQSLLSIYLITIPICMGVAMTYNTLLTLFSDAVTADEQGRTMGISVGLTAISWSLGSTIISLEVTAQLLSITYWLLTLLLSFAFYSLRQKQKRDSRARSANLIYSSEQQSQ